MKINILTVFLLFLIIAPVYAQETGAPKPKKLQQLYFSYSPGKAFSNSEDTGTGGWHRKLHITATNRHNYVLRFGSSYTSLADDQPMIRKWNEDYPDKPFNVGHYIFSPHLLIGKRKVLSEWLQVQVLAGPSYNDHNRSVNIHRITEDFGAFGKQERLIYEMKTRFSPGFLVQTEVMALPLRFAGLTLGGYYQYIPGISYAGFNLSLNLGLLRHKNP